MTLAATLCCTLYQTRRASTKFRLPCLTVSILFFEKRYHNSAGTHMGSDHTSHGRVADFF